MKNYRVVGYIPAGVHRWKRIEKIVTVDDTICESGNKNAAIGKWLMQLELMGRVAGTPYEIKSVEEVENG